MEDLKQYEKILENLGEESNNYDYVVNMVKDLKGKSVEDNIKVPDFDYSDIESEEILDEYDTKELENEIKSEKSPSFSPVNLIDPVVDELFKNIDTDEYREKREKGGFGPKFVEENLENIEEDIGEEIEISEDELEAIIPQTEDVFEIKTNISGIESELNKIEEEINIDDLLKDAEKIVKTEKEEKKEESEEIEENIEEVPTEKEEKVEEMEDLEGIEEIETLEDLGKENKDLEEVEEVKEVETPIGVEEIETIKPEPEEKEVLEEISEEVEEIKGKEETEEKEIEDIDHLKSFVEGEDYGSDMTFTLDEEEHIEPLKETKIEKIEENVEEVSEVGELEEVEEFKPKEEAMEEKPEIEEIGETREIEEPEEKEEEYEILGEIEKEDIKEIKEEGFQEKEEKQEEIKDFLEEESFESLEDEYKKMGLKTKVKEDIKEDKIPKEIIQEYKREEKREEKKEDKIFQANLNRLPVSLMLRLKEVFSDPSVSPRIKQSIKTELSKLNPDIDRIKGFLGYEEREAKSFIPVFRFASIMIILAILFSIIYFSLLKPYLRNKNLLLSGLEDIKNGNYVLANEKFDRADPSLYWYNRYALEFMKYKAYKQAEEKLMGIRGPNHEVIKKGGVDIDPDDRETRLNIAKVFEEQGMYEKVLENDAAPNMQYDDSLYYLYKKDPSDFSIVDKIGLTYVKWGNSFRKKSEKLPKYQKAHQIYTNYYETQEKENEVISRILYTSALIGDNVEEKFDDVQKKGLLEKMHDITLAQVGMYFIQNEEYKRTQKIIEVLNNMGTTEPFVYYMMGNFYYNIGNLKLAEKALVKGERFSWEIENEIKKRIIDEKTYSNIMNMLGNLYVSLANEYKGETEENKKKREEFIKLAYYHFNQAKKYNPNNKETYYRYANMMYDYYSDYLKASENYLISYNLYREEEEMPPLDMYYKLSASFYFLGDYDKSLEYLNDLRMNPSFRVRPAMEYILGMLYFKKGMLLDSRQKFLNTMEYYNKELESYIRNPNPMSIRQNKILFFNSILNNNIGVTYHMIADRERNNEYYNIARVHFYKAMELAHRYNNKTILALARLNLNDSIFQENIKYVEHFNIKRDPILYDYIPKYLEEYE